MFQGLHPITCVYVFLFPLWSIVIATTLHTDNRPKIINNYYNSWCQSKTYAYIFRSASNSDSTKRSVKLLQYNWTEQKLFSHENSEVFAYVAAPGVWNYQQLFLFRVWTIL